MSDQILRLFEYDTNVQPQTTMVDQSRVTTPVDPEMPDPVCARCGSKKCGGWDEDVTSEWLALQGDIPLSELTVCQRERVEKMMGPGWDSPVEESEDSDSSDDEYVSLTRIESVEVSPELLEFLTRASNHHSDK